MGTDVQRDADTPPRSREHPTDALVTPAWVADRLEQFRAPDPDYRLVEVDLNPAFYADEHIPGAVGLDWERDLRATDRVDVVGPAAFSDLLGRHGIDKETTVVAYGDNSGLFAAHFYWLCRYYGHDDVRLLDGGRGGWLAEDRPTTDAVPDPPVVDYGPVTPDESIRTRREAVFDAVTEPSTPPTFVDVRLPEEYTGELTAPPGLGEAAQRGGHIPGAVHVYWDENRTDGRFRPPDQLRELYADRGVTPDEPVVTYCRIGERSAMTWFVLHELLDYEDVSHYDGSWVEWGNLVGAPIETGGLGD
ncbi:sulfurtransferase [Halosegnis sp.]|uniref:sulfurtransferase n=1 Tax=Halosegnis sp. TaxID=2864959 RepID=UPI0035D4C5ED